VRPYEVMVIFDTGTEPPAIQTVVDQVLETVRTTGGTPGTVDRWGRRPFAYEVKHRREGYYVLVEFAGGVQTVNDLDRMLSLADEVLRHKVIRLPEKVVRRAASGTAGGKANRTGPPPAPAPLPERPAAAGQPAGEPAQAAAETAEPAAETAEPAADEPADEPAQPAAETEPTERDAPADAASEQVAG